MKGIEVLQVLSGKIIAKYKDLHTAANAVDGQESHISECMRHIPHRNTHKGYEWRSSDETDSSLGKTKNKENT